MDMGVPSMDCVVGDGGLISDTTWLGKRRHFAYFGLAFD
jgi:hypothetical protein